MAISNAKYCDYKTTVAERWALLEASFNPVQFKKGDFSGLNIEGSRSCTLAAFPLASVLLHLRDADTDWFTAFPPFSVATPLPSDPPVS